MSGELNVNVVLSPLPLDASEVPSDASGELTVDVLLSPFPLDASEVPCDVLRLSSLLSSGGHPNDL